MFFTKFIVNKIRVSIRKQEIRRKRLGLRYCCYISPKIFRIPCHRNAVWQIHAVHDPYDAITYSCDNCGKEASLLRLALAHRSPIRVPYYFLHKMAFCYDFKISLVQLLH